MRIEAKEGKRTLVSFHNQLSGRDKTQLNAVVIRYATFVSLHKQVFDPFYYQSPLPILSTHMFLSSVALFLSLSRLLLIDAFVPVAPRVQSVSGQSNAPRSLLRTMVRRVVFSTTVCVWPHASLKVRPSLSTMFRKPVPLWPTANFNWKNEKIVIRPLPVSV